MFAAQTVQQIARYPSRTAMVGICVFLLASCDQPERAVAPGPVTAIPEPRFTPGSGSTPTFLGQARYSHFGVVSRVSPDWDVELKATKGVEVIVRSFAYSPGAYTGWHKHPGPVLIQVIEGTLTFYEASAPCTPIVVTAGHGYVDTGEQGHIGRNLSGAPAKDITIFFAPPGTQVSQLRIDMPEPAGACNP